ncbi:hypothetical protein BDF19DRAFT_231660 [Syncephalis fuscata]|nr:hypothetical protein BDF19DRAFT_231660 [Syncephalis fuscata]
MGDTWKVNATNLFGILLHPDGEMDFLGFVNRKQQNYETAKDEVQKRLTVVQFQMMLSVVLGTLFAYNLRRLLQHITVQSYSLLDLCYFIPSFLGIGYTMLAIVAALTNHLNCRIIVWYIMIAISFSMFCNSIVILYKTYIVLLSQRRVAICGTVCILPQLFFSLVACKHSYITLEKQGGCVFNYNTTVALYWFTMMIPSNILFSGIFSAVVYKHYKKYGSDA